MSEIVKLNTCCDVECEKVEKRVDEFSICSRCKKVQYCSRKCQKNHWREHKKVCRKPSKLQTSREDVIKLVSEDGSKLENFPEYNNDREIISLAAKQFGPSVRFAGEQLRTDKGVVLAAVKENGCALQFLGEEFRNDKEIVIAAVKQRGDTISYASESLRKDEEVAFAAFNQELEALEYVHRDLLGKKTFMTKVVTQAPHGLEYCSYGLKDDKDVVLAAVRQDQSVLRFASFRLQKYFEENPRDMLNNAKGEEGEHEGEEDDETIKKMKESSSDT